MIEYLSNQKLEEALTNDLTIVDFFATWCGPCKMLGMELEDLKDIKILKVDVDEHEDLAREHGVMSVPTVEIYNNKKLVNSFIGYKSKEEIEKILKSI